MKSGIFSLLFLGILLVGKCQSLKKSQSENSFLGAYFSNVGRYNFVDTKDDTFLTSYTLTGLENALGNAKRDKRMRFSEAAEKLEANLNEIYKVCQKNRASFLPYGISPIPESQLKTKIDRALNDSVVILSDLTSLYTKNYTDTFGIKEKMNITDKYSRGYNYLYPTHVQDFEVAKKYINFTFVLQKISSNAAVINVRMAVPILVKADLHRISYVPTQRKDSKTFEFLRDQSISNLVATDNGYNNYGYNYNSNYFLIKNIDNCELVNENFLCDPILSTKIDNNSNTCLTLLFRSDCDWEDNWRMDCKGAREACIYEQSQTRYKEFTFIGENKFFVLMTRPANYIYQCDNGRKEVGQLIFKDYGDHKFTGTVEIDDNCKLITAHTTVSNKDGVYEIKEIDNEDLIWADVPKIIGVPVWIFWSAVGVTCLITLMLLITWICICVKRCRAKKATPYNNLNGSN